MATEAVSHGKSESSLNSAERISWQDLSRRKIVTSGDIVDFVDSDVFNQKFINNLPPEILEENDFKFNSQLEELWEVKYKRQGVPLDSFLKNYSRYTSSIWVWNKLTGEWGQFLNRNDYMTVFTSRITPLETPLEQERSRNSRGLLLGMSTNSSVFRGLVQSGFMNFVISDPDEISLSNLSRLSDANGYDIDKNKALFMANTGLRLNPYLNLKCFPRALDYEEIVQELEATDFVVEMVDDIRTKITIRDIAQHVANISNSPKYVIMGTNLFNSPLITVDLRVPDDSSSQPKEAGRYFQNPSLTPGDIQNLLSTPANDDWTQEEKMNFFLQKTALAVKVIGLKNIPQRHLACFILSAVGELGYWAQTGVDAQEVATIVINQVKNVINGRPIQFINKTRVNSSGQVGDGEYFDYLCRTYPQIYKQDYGNLIEANKILYSDILLPYLQ